MTRDGWDPAQYERFAAERAQPFHDLLAMVEPAPSGSVVDLGCGTGELTALLHTTCGAATTVGVDNSPAMLDKAAAFASDGVRFELGDITEVAAAGQRYDLVFANAALQWVPDHASLIPRVAALVTPGGQLAVQVPANADHPSHLIAAEVATEAPFAGALGSDLPPDPVRGVLRPEQYAELLYALGFERQHVRLQVYGHVLPSSASVVEWTKGTTLTRFRRLLSDDLFDAFVQRYTERLVDALGPQEPYFYAFKRILFWARLPA